MRVSLFLCLSLCSSTVCAATFTVTKTADTADGACNSDCSLREAILAANGNAGADIVRLKATSYHLSLGELPVEDSVEVRGLPTSRSTISADSTGRVVSVPAGATVTLTDLVLRDGFAYGQGGALKNEGNLTLRRVTVGYSRVVASQGSIAGGGIYNAGALRILDSTIIGNVARDDATLTGGRGGGIYNAKPGSIHMYNSAVRENVTGEDDSTGYGGGIYNASQLRVDRAFFWKNDPGDGEGSAIANRDGGSMAVLHTTISNNGHDGADGAIANGSWSEAQAESLSQYRPQTSLYNVTIANNNGGGLLNTGKVQAKSSFIAGNYTQDGNDKFWESPLNCHSENGGKVLETYTVVGAGNCPGMLYAVDRSVFTGWLEHLRYYGGPTPVHKPLNAALIDSADPDYCSGGLTDQRGAPRPADGNGDGVAACDIGAMELQPGE